MSSSLTDRLVLREILPPLLVGLAAILQLLVLAQLLQLNEVIFGSAITLVDLFWVTFGLLPHFLVTAAPLAFVLGVQLGVGRLHGDRELLALASTGQSPLRLYRVPVALALLLALGVLGLARWAEPWGLHRLNAVLDEVIKRNLEEGLSPGVFNDSLPRVMIYAEQKGTGPGGLPLWQGLLIEDRTNDGAPLLTLAAEGRISGQGDESLGFELRGGEVHRSEAGEQGETRLRFDEGQLVLSMGDRVARKNVFHTSEAALSDAELLERARAFEERGDQRLAGRARLERVRRVAVPLACLAFVLLAVPLAMVSGGNRGAAYVTTLLAFALFYVLQRVSLSIAERGGSPWFAGFLPALVVVGLGLVFSARLLVRGVGSGR